MTRRKITEEAEQQADESDSEQSDSSGSENDREQLTQRMPSDLVEQVDEFAENHGMSRNAAINFLVKRSLGDL